MSATSPRGKLAVHAWSEDGTTGFLVFGDDQVSFEPAAVSGCSYAPLLRRWVDVHPQKVAPDGGSYVTTNGAGEVIIVDRTGARTLAGVPPDVRPVAFTPDGVLLQIMPRSGPPDHRFHAALLDPVSGKYQQLPPFGNEQSSSGSSSVGYTQSANPVWSSSTGYIRSGNSLWRGEYDHATGCSTLLRNSLPTGATAVWFEARQDERGFLHVVGADSSGRPVVQLSPEDVAHTAPKQRRGMLTETALLSAPHEKTVLNQGRMGEMGVVGCLSPLSLTVGDEVWLAADDGDIWLLEGKIHRVARIATSPEGPPGVAISALIR